VQFPGATHRNIYVQSERAGQRVMKSITKFITQKLKLKGHQHRCDDDGTGSVYAGLAQLLRLLRKSSRTLLAGSVRDFVWHSGDNGKHPVVVGQLSWNWASAQNWRATRLAAAAVPGTSPTLTPYPSRFPQPTLNRSVSRICRMSVSVTISNRRVRTRTHGGVAGVSGQPLPYADQVALPEKWVLGPT
jgi:hypothetical protein